MLYFVVTGGGYFERVIGGRESGFGDVLKFAIRGLTCGWALPPKCHKKSVKEVVFVERRYRALNLFAVGIQFLKFCVFLAFDGS